MAVVDGEGRLYIYDARTLDLVMQETRVNAVSFNSEVEEMLCYSQPDSTNTFLTIGIKTGWATGVAVQQVGKVNGLLLFFICIRFFLIFKFSLVRCLADQKVYNFLSYMIYICACLYIYTQRIRSSTRLNQQLFLLSPNIVDEGLPGFHHRWFPIQQSLLHTSNDHKHGYC